MTSQCNLDIFEAARDQFLGALSPEDRLLYSPCASAEDFREAIKKLEATATRVGRRSKPMRCVYTLSKHLEPYFEVVGIFVQSNPEFSALFWGAFRLVLKLSSNLVTFFEKLLELLDQLLTLFPRYEDVAKLCNDENSERIRKNIEEVYVDFLGIFQTAVKVFTRSAGKLKRTPMVLGSLLWQPFDVRFKELLERMEVHSHNISEEIKVWKLKRDGKQIAATATWREYVQKEHQRAEHERALAQEERRLMAEERRLMEVEREENAHSRTNIPLLLSEIQDAKSHLEQQRLDATVARVQEWLRPSDHVDARESNSKLRDGSTALWIFDHPQYRSWMDEEHCRFPRGYKRSRKFATNMLWIHGHPGSGKTVLSTSVLDELDESEVRPEDKIRIVLYHFFRFNSEASRSPASAFRSLLSQILWCCRHDKDVVDKFTFMMTSKSQGQLDASEGALDDLLQICLDSNAIIVVDGVDECSDSDSFVSSLLRLSSACNPRILLLSRINVPQLQRSVLIKSQLSLSKEELSRDIRLFCEHKLEDLIEEELLPDSASNDLKRLVEHLVNGADGMFLWARLMFEFLRSTSLSQKRRMNIIAEIKFPEGLEKMYHRIFLLISQSGDSTRKLATHIFTWLVFGATTMTTRQSRQTLVIEGLWTSDTSEDISEIESAMVMACKGLVELIPMSKYLPNVRGLQLIHSTVKEILTRPDATSYLESTSVSQDLVKLPTMEIANFNIARCCLRQLLHHTPAGPLSGHMHQSISSLDLAANFPFTDYAAIYWLQHASATIIEASKIMTYDGQVDKSFENAFHDFAVDLRKFLTSPKTITAWLEAFYTSSHSGRPSGSGIREWASWLSELAQETKLRVDGVLLGMIFEFRSDLDRIVQVWDSNLRLTPHIVWDELTASGLAPSQMFFSSGSTRAKSRAPNRPSDFATAVANHPEASISAVSADGTLLGVLSVWSAPNSRSTTFKREVIDNIFIASYELWPLDLDRQCVARVSIQLDAQDRKCFNMSSQKPMSISCDNLSFSVSHKIWRLNPHPKSLAGGLTQEPWQNPIEFSTVTIPNNLSDKEHGDLCDLRITFSPAGRYVILQTLYRRFHHPDRSVTPIELQPTVAAFELTPAWDAVPLLSLALGHSFKSKFQVVFHPTRTLCVLWVGADEPLDPNVSECFLYFWNYEIVPSQLRRMEDSIFPLEAVHFSECGLYLISKTKYMNAVTVTQIPPDLLYSESERPSAHSEEKSELRSEPSPKRITLAEPDPFISDPNTHLQLHKFGPGRMVKDFAVSLDPGNTIALSSSMTNDGLELRVSQMDGSGTDIVRLAALPNWPGSSNSTAELKLPELAGGSIMIIIHKTDAEGCGDVQLPMVIERDSRFFTQPRAFLNDASWQTSYETFDGDEDEYGEDEEFDVPKYSDTQGESSKRRSKKPRLE